MEKSKSNLPRSDIEQVVKTGFTQEDLNSGIEGRDPLIEFTEDAHILEMITALTLGDYSTFIKRLVGNKSPQIVDILEHIRDGLESFQGKVGEITRQTLLIPAVQGQSGGTISVKQRQLHDYKEEMRDWFNLVMGAKNVALKNTHDFPYSEDLAYNMLCPEHEKRQSYGRSFSDGVYGWEKEFAQTMKVGDVALCNSGMSAIEACLRAEELKPTDTILTGKSFYTLSRFLLKELQDKGINVVQVDPSDIDSVNKLVNKYKPKLLFFEGISNTPTMEVADISNLLKQNAEWNNRNPQNTCRLIIDNTFATLVLQHVGQQVKDQNLSGAKWAAVESATKYYQGQGWDNILAGLVYSSDTDFIQEVKRRRGMIGLHLQERLAKYLPKPSAELLTQKILRHSMNALFLSANLEAMGMKITYPHLNTHLKHKVAVSNYPKGTGGVFFINWQKEHGNPQEFVNSVKEEARKLGAEVKIGVSFGHPQTWLETLPPNMVPGGVLKNWQPGDTREWAIRISAGEENIIAMQKVLAAFKNVYGNKL